MSQKPTKRGWSTTMEQALQVMELVLSSGYYLLPDKPSAQMISAGMQAGDVDAATVERIYQAIYASATTNTGAASGRDPAALLEMLVEVTAVH